MPAYGRWDLIRRLKVKMAFCCDIKLCSLLCTDDVVEKHSATITRAIYFPWRNSPQWSRASSLWRIHDHIQTHHHTRQDSSGRVISPMQRPLPDITQHSHGTDIHDLGGIQIHIPRKESAADARLRPRGHWTGIVTECSSGTVVCLPEYRLSYLFEKTLNFICEYRKDVINSSTHNLNYLKIVYD